MSRIIWYCLLALIAVLKVALLLMSVWYGWKAVTLGLVPEDPGPFILYGAISVATGGLGLSKIDLTKED